MTPRSHRSDDGLEVALRHEGFVGELRPHCPLAPYTSWRIGGPAELLAFPSDRADLVRAVRWAAREGIGWRVLGNGSNLLVRDEGVRGLVLRIRRVLDDVRIEPQGRLSAGAGASFPATARLAASAGLAGLEFAAGIPATVGGAIVMNAGWHQYEIGNHVESVEALDANGAITRLDRGACGFGYRRSAFRGSQRIVLAACLRLAPGDAAEIRSRMESFAASRKANQPTDLPSCGSVFLKPEGDYAGRLIEAAGLKGLRVGDVEVSTKHANFFVNLGRARSVEVLELVGRVERIVEDRFGVRLQREFEVW